MVCQLPHSKEPDILSLLSAIYDEATDSYYEVISQPEYITQTLKSE